MSNLPTNIQFNVQIWKDEDTGAYISYVPQLDVSSSGNTPEESRINIQDAVEGFLDAAKEMGTLSQVLQEAGFHFDENWKAPELVSFETMRLAF